MHTPAPLSFATAYYPDYYPESDWARDLGRIQASGLRAVRILEFGWSWYQPTPEAFNFDAMDRFLDLCTAHGLQVVIGTPTATPPPWFFQRYPDARLVNVDGRSCFRHRHMTCWNHPAARAEAFRTVETLATRYGGHPAVWGWQIDNEPNYAEELHGYYDFNPHALADGRRWLQAKYGSLDALNAAWFTAFWSQVYTDWAQVWATHLPVAQVNPQSALDFLRWRDANMAEFVQAQAALLRHCTAGQAIGVNIPETGAVFSVPIGQDYWAQAQGLDWVGTDLYAASGKRAQDLASLAFCCDLMRSVARDASLEGARFIIAESQGGPHYRAWHTGFAPETVEPDYLRQCAGVFRAHGAEQVWWFMWRPTPAGAEIGMNAVCDLAGDPTPYTQMVAEIAAAPAQFDAALDAYAARPVALLDYSRDTLLFNYLMEGNNQSLADAQNGVHGQLDALGYRVDFINDAALEGGAIPDAACLVLAETQLLSDAAQAHVREWVEADVRRTLVLGPSVGLLNEHGHLRAPRQQPLWQWLGVTPGHLVDTDFSVAIDGATITAFRQFRLPEGAVVREATPWQGESWPLVFTLPAARVTVYAYRWGLTRAVGQSTAIPAP